MDTTLIAWLAVAALAQDGQDAGAAAPASVPARNDQSVTATELKERIHGMRMNLLTGGPKVREAEQEAVGFYGGKVELIEQRLDTIRAELSEKRAAYDIALENALGAETAASRRDAMGDAASLRAALTELESEAALLEQKRTGLNKMITAVESRERERERLVTQLETAESFEYGLDFPLATIGLAPDLPEAAAASPIANDALVADLMARDPRGARRILYESDPVGYWDRFPLRPPGGAVIRAMEFPLPDLPGRR